MGPETHLPEVGALETALAEFGSRNDRTGQTKSTLLAGKQDTAQTVLRAELARRF